jgi:hypothetical protein
MFFVVGDPQKEISMAHRKHLTILGTAAAIAAVLALALAYSPKGQAAGGGDDSESKIQRGFAIAPVPLNLKGKNRAQVGMGSYLVNAVGDCNGCHFRALSASSPFTVGHNPYLGEPKQIDPAGYLAGGNDLFGPFVPRNLTPDKTGRPEGGATYEEFLGIMRTGIDPDQAHPQFGPFLQVMPWPAFQDMTDNDLRAIYEYLSSIPCIEGDPGLPPRVGTRCS